MAADASRLGIDVWESMLRVHAALVPVLAGEVEAQTRLPLSWYDVLFELNSTDGKRLRMQDLGDRVVLSRTRVSRIVDEMVEAGLVEKSPDPEDGRASLAIITRNGRATLRRAAPVYLKAIDEHFTTHLQERELQALRSGLQRILDSLTPKTTGSTNKEPRVLKR
ncbi:MAG: MarR family transcriptional regulator [Acidimicrobiia bacterium]|nr:MarR family transcriptional regulator [Acidimicrobiia bacterium]